MYVKALEAAAAKGIDTNSYRDLDKKDAKTKPKRTKKAKTS
jgi:hypothetical protein